MCDFAQSFLTRRLPASPRINYIEVARHDGGDYAARDFERCPTFNWQRFVVMRSKLSSGFHARRVCLIFLIGMVSTVGSRGWANSPEPTPYEVGLARVDVTPQTPIRLSGFASRLTESTGVRHPIYARAMAIRPASGGEPVVVITVDSLCIPAYLRDEVASRLKAKKNIANDRLAICSTHSHTAPMVSKALETLFGQPIPPEHVAHIDQYTKELIDKIEQAALEALGDMKPARLAFGIGNVGFSINRRKRGGPVDHDLPVMFVQSADGKVRGAWVNYACHCVVLSDYQVSGDWAGFAAAELEKMFKDSVVLLSVGCGADSNPESGVKFDKGEIAEGYGHQVATEVDRLFHSKLTPLDGPIDCQLESITLDLQDLPTREKWEERAKAASADGYFAKVELAKLDAGEKLPTTVKYPIQTWKFGKSLATVFLSGEVVADYARRLKQEFDPKRLWLNAYTNDDPGYIPSERVLKEGGYEGGGAMIYYGLPAPFAPGLEEKIVATAGKQLGEEFKPDAKNGTQGSLPRSAAESMAAMKVHDGFRVELVAFEPMVQSPVAIDFGADGMLWVAEMRDYGCKDGEKCPPNGRVSVLEDRDRDGNFEKATVFLDNIAEPMGITVFKKGVLISAVPDLIYAEDTNGDNKADVVEKLFTGFSTENPQARLNSLAIGLDGWYQGGGMFIGNIKNKDGREFNVGNRDFRIRPETGEIDGENGQTENSRVRDDWGNWFGCENGSLAMHFPISDRYLRRSPSLVAPPTSVHISSREAAKLHPAGKLVLFELSGPAGRATAACGITIFRSDLWGPRFAGNAFTCEPVTQLVHRSILEPKGTTFVANRAPEEEKTEFLTSTDNWFRPVQARVGPDGNLWVVDMYRYVIEHTRWIPQETQKQLDVYAGSNMGRIYRIIPKINQSVPLPQLSQFETPRLAMAMDNPFGTRRDMIQQQLIWRGDDAAVEPLSKVAAQSVRPAARIQALCTLDLMGKLRDEQIEKALADSDAHVRRQAVRLAESRLKKSPKLLEEVVKLAADSDALVALQVACSLGETSDAKKVEALQTLLKDYAKDPYVTAGALSSLDGKELGTLLTKLVPISAGLPRKMVERLAELAGSSAERETVIAGVALVEQTKGDKADQFSALESYLKGLRRNPQKNELLAGGAAERLQTLASECLKVAKDANAKIETRAVCIRVVGGTPDAGSSQVESLVAFLGAENDTKLQLAAVDALAEKDQPEVASNLLGAWRTLTPALRAKTLDVLLSRKQWVAPLLAAIEAQTIAASEIDAAHRSQLTNYPDEELRSKAAASFAHDGNAARAAVFERYLPLVAKAKGDAARGKAVFEKNCGVCHKVHDVGTQVGPDIAARQDKSNEGLLREILDPNRAVDQRFADYVSVTAYGVVKNGILVEDTSGSITLRGQQGQDTRLLRSELESLTSSGKSLMPEGLENQISPEQMADLLSFLASP
jgi:putative membrane-bound dehydrogenase-like protein